MYSLLWFDLLFQILCLFKAPVKEQIRHKLICFEGEPKSSKVRSAMKWSSKCISMVINKTDSIIITTKKHFTSSNI